MDIILQLLKDYSAPVVVLIALGAALIYLFKEIVQKAIASQFDAQSKRAELLLQRRSNFEEKILIDQYSTISDLQLRIKKIEADINRMRHGLAVEGLIKDNDIVPLSDVFIELVAKSFMLKKRLYDLLVEEVKTLISFARANDPDEVKKYEKKILKLNDDIRSEMNVVFGIDQITWDSIGKNI